ncbi:hypothetical protein ABEF92_001553 [Exophiala dermatitidis]|uniref:Uncharacterized protein n=1 Tax=Exophiala dermatitidis (strain ATCC 34100 / CBS 525.76 / NIH/UT8656) TaxID=858893 RepID=H6C964_EXODN|nr:uncharacterized protein HMPREF1120_08592 [Exophiala dermatitidis NIH/UT8656]EHY60640.1 hypothetical protein HMPREF1120_08592 [Exophiala dermatitidis NIH/UT8656]
MPLRPDSFETPDPSPPPFPLTDVDRAVLAMSDDEFQPHTWEELKQIIAEHDLSVLKRRPSDLRRYQAWSADIKARYGSVPNFVMAERLQWSPLPSSAPDAKPEFAVKNPVPFADPDDYKILLNDWPYGLAPGIGHLIVWLKTRLESEPTRGDMTPESRQQVEEFIQKTFVDRIKDLPGEPEKIMWFRNWTALQSVPGLEHVHVLVRDVPEDIVREWTDGVPPLHEEVAQFQHQR